MRQPLRLVLAALFLFPAASLTLAAGKDEARGDKVDYEVHHGYLQRVKYYLAFRAADRLNLGTLCSAAFTNQDSFDRAFGKSDGKVVNLSEFMLNGEDKGAKANHLPKDAFDKKMVVAMIHNDMNIYKYKVAKVTADGETLYVQYTTTSSAGYPNSYSCPLIVSVDKGKYTSVVFIENGRKFGTAAVAKTKAKDD
jgi:hypothetical protein